MSARVAVIAGGTSAVSDQIAQTLEAEGCVVVVLKTNDLRDEQQCIVAEHGPVTDLVWVGGGGSTTELKDLTRADWDTAVRENVSDPFRVLQAFVPAMAAVRQGAVVLITGQQARRGVAGQAHVAAASWGLIGMAKTIALEVAESGVRVTVISAGPLKAHAVDDLPQPRSYVEPQEIADAVAFLLSDKAKSWTGAVVDISLGLAARNTA
jgi:NAD(P)-dependent dehydrogenase (short-subunit alcohol dehydrogenase family)